MLFERLATDAATPDPRETLQRRLTTIRQQARRLVDALADGTELASVKERLAELERERARLEKRLDRVRAVAPGTSNLTATVDDMIRSLRWFREVLNGGNVEDRRAVVRALLQEIRVMKATRQVVLRWYRLPRDLSLSWWS